jgi:hypothetical protein
MGEKKWGKKNKNFNVPTSTWYVAAAALGHVRVRGAPPFKKFNVLSRRIKGE